MSEYIYTIEQIKIIARGLGAASVAMDGKITDDNRAMGKEMLAAAELQLRQGKKVDNV